jgi:hypothetical protein
MAKFKEEMAKFKEKLERLKENGEDAIRLNTIVQSLNIESNFYDVRRSHVINKDYIKVLHNVDYLDCAGLDFGTTLQSFTQWIEPCSGQNTSYFIQWVNTCKRIFRLIRSSKWGSISSILFAIYAQTTLLDFKPKELPPLLDCSLRCAIENDNYLLIFEIVRMYLFDQVILLQTIFKDNIGVRPGVIELILQASRQRILRKFSNLYNNVIILSFCRDCEQGNRLVMVMSYKGNIEMSDRIPNEILGCKLVLKSVLHVPNEASSVFKSIPVFKKAGLPTVTEDEAKELFRKHSNLTMISASPYKSIGYSKGRHRIVEKLCISLLCIHKGYIPYGEEQFPKKIGEVEVDVQEGYCYFGTQRSLESGGHVKRKVGSGSIGGFVDLPNNKVGLITCAHVVFSSDELLNGQFLDTSIIEVEAFDKRHHSFSVCGKCITAKFPQCKVIGQPALASDSSNASVDAALIDLDQDINTFEFRAVTQEQLQSAGNLINK